MKLHLRQAQIADASAVAALVQAGFNEFVAPDWEPQAREVFATESSPDRFAQLLAEPAFASVAEAGERVVGFILLPTPNLLGFLFIDGRVHRQGIAKALWQAARAHIEAAHRSVKTVELNSSPYAVSAYRALGFYPISEPFKRGGCVATRMASWLPGQALAAPNAA